MFDDIAAPQPRGRPSRFSNEIATEVCDRLAAGESLQSICRDRHLPHERTVRRWAIEDHEGFSPRYTRERELQTECLIDQIVAIADSVADERESSPAVHAARLRVDARKWIASKMLPRKYGDRLGVDSTGSLTIKIVHGLADAPDE